MWKKQVREIFNFNFSLMTEKMARDFYEREIRRG